LSRLLLSLLIVWITLSAVLRGFTSSVGSISRLLRVLTNAIADAAGCPLSHESRTS